MYIKKISIVGIRSIEKFELDLNQGEYAGWHVVIGDNGSGKSTLVRAIALALVGPNESGALRQNWDEWLRYGYKKGHVYLDIDSDPSLDKATGKGKSVANYFIPANVFFEKDETSTGKSVKIVFKKNNKVDTKRYIWGENAGWFCASYGPFRRFTGGDKSYEKLFHSHPKLASHLSAFGEDVALTECLDWLRTLHIKQLENKNEDSILDDLKSFINSGELLPHGTILHKISSDEIVFKDGNDFIISVEQLSDGYRSVLSMTFEMIRQMVRTYGAKKVFNNIRKGVMNINVPGVVVIDEIDAHLHPTWQHRIGQWLCKFFPKIQFIVTTHSPIVCQAAEKGSIWRLTAPGSGLPSGRVKDIERQRLIYGSILDAYSTELFGRDVTRSETSKGKMLRLAQLNMKWVQGSLGKKEEDELNLLRSILPTAANVGNDSKGCDK